MMRVRDRDSPGRAVSVFRAGKLQKDNGRIQLVSLGGWIWTKGGLYAVLGRLGDCFWS